MQIKEYLIVGAGALLLANASIVATLLATGYIGGEVTEAEAETEQVQPNDEPLPLSPAPPKVIHSMTKAIYTCEDKLSKAISGKEVSYQFDPVASRYDSPEGIYYIFFETHTSSRSTAPQKNSSVICEVSDQDMTIKGYKTLPL